MVVLSTIYTKTGDNGTTALGDGSRVSKTDSRIQAFATVDEANSYLGVILTLELSSDIRNSLKKIQNDLFDVGADLCTPVVDSPTGPQLRVTDKQVSQLETWIDLANSSLSPLRSFVLPGGTVAAAHLHFARTIVRRAERETWGAIHDFGDGVNPLTAKYLNRLSDLLFVLARFANNQHGETLWIPGGQNEN